MTPSYSFPGFTLFYYLFCDIGLELRALYLLGRCSTALATPLAHFALDILEMGSLKLFAWVGLEPRSS
jgi:hypothetical protein